MDAQIAQYEQRLFDKIPICKNMGVRISYLAGDEVRIKAPLQENINYHGTAFGGSLNAVAILTSYLMLHHLLHSRGITFKHVVIKSGDIRFVAPTTHDFEALCRLPQAEVVEEFLSGVQNNGRGRIQLITEIRCQPEDNARVVFKGTFVALQT